MAHRGKFLLAGMALTLVLVTSFAAEVQLFLRESHELATQAPPIPAELQPATRVGHTGGIAGDTQTFRVVPEWSELAYFVDVRLPALPLLTYTAKGTTNEIEGEFFLRDGLQLASDRTSWFAVDLRQLKSQGVPDRVVSPHNVLDTRRFPRAIFWASAIAGPSVSSSEDEYSFRLRGTLDLNGVRRDVTWEVEAHHRGGVITALATARLRYRDFNIAAADPAGTVRMDDTFILQVQLVAETPENAAAGRAPEPR